MFKRQESDDDSYHKNTLLQTIYVPKNLMFLTDNLPKPKYNGGSDLSLYVGSDNNSLPKTMRKHAENVSLPNSSNIINQVKLKEKRKPRVKEQKEEKVIPRKNISINLHHKTPGRVRNKQYKPNDRSYSLENHDLSKVPSIESLKNIDHKPIIGHKKLSSVERIASKLSMHNRINTKMPRIDQNAYNDHNLSLDNHDLSILSIKNKNIPLR